MKGGGHKRVYTAWSYIHDIQRQAKLIYGNKGQNSGYLWEGDIG